MGFRHRDYAKLATRSHWRTHICTDGNGNRFIGEDIMIFSTTDIFIRFKSTDKNIRIHANTYKNFSPELAYYIMFRAVSSNGLIEIWAEGKLQIL